MTLINSSMPELSSGVNAVLSEINEKTRSITLIQSAWDEAVASLRESASRYCESYPITRFFLSGITDEQAADEITTCKLNQARLIKILDIAKNVLEFEALKKSKEPLPPSFSDISMHFMQHSDQDSKECEEIKKDLLNQLSPYKDLGHAQRFKKHRYAATQKLDGMKTKVIHQYYENKGAWDTLKLDIDWINAKFSFIKEYSFGANLSADEKKIVHASVKELGDAVKQLTKRIAFLPTTEWVKKFQEAVAHEYNLMNIGKDDFITEQYFKFGELGVKASLNPVAVAHLLFHCADSWSYKERDEFLKSLKTILKDTAHLENYSSMPIPEKFRTFYFLVRVEDICKQYRVDPELFLKICNIFGEEALAELFNKQDISIEEHIWKMNFQKLATKMLELDVHLAPIVSDGLFSPRLYILTLFLYQNLSQGALDESRKKEFLSWSIACAFSLDSEGKYAAMKNYLLQADPDSLYIEEFEGQLDCSNRKSILHALQSPSSPLRRSLSVQRMLLHKEASKSSALFVDIDHLVKLWAEWKESNSLHALKKHESNPFMKTFSLTKATLAAIHPSKSEDLDRREDGEAAFFPLSDNNSAELNTSMRFLSDRHLLKQKGPRVQIATITEENHSEPFYIEAPLYTYDPSLFFKLQGRPLTVEVPVDHRSLPIDLGISEKSKVPQKGLAFNPKLNFYKMGEQYAVYADTQSCQVEGVIDFSGDVAVEFSHGRQRRYAVPFHTIIDDLKSNRSLLNREERAAIDSLDSRNGIVSAPFTANVNILTKEKPACELIETEAMQQAHNRAIEDLRKQYLHKIHEKFDEKYTQKIHCKEGETFLVNGQAMQLTPAATTLSLLTNQNSEEPNNMRLRLKGNADEGQKMFFDTLLFQWADGSELSKKYQWIFRVNCSDLPDSSDSNSLIEVIMKDNFPMFSKVNETPDSFSWSNKPNLLSPPLEYTRSFFQNYLHELLFGKEENKRLLIIFEQTNALIWKNKEQFFPSFSKALNRIAKSGHVDLIVGSTDGYHLGAIESNFSPALLEGLTPQGIQAYIDDYIYGKDQETVKYKKSIEEHLATHHVLYDACKDPQILRALLANYNVMLCESAQESVGIDRSISTIVSRLLRNYGSKTAKFDEWMLQGMTDSCVKEKLQKELLFLEYIAFFKLINKAIDFEESLSYMKGRFGEEFNDNMTAIQDFFFENERFKHPIFYHYFAVRFLIKWLSSAQPINKIFGEGSKDQIAHDFNKTLQDCQQKGLSSLQEVVETLLANEENAPICEWMNKSLKFDDESFDIKRDYLSLGLKKRYVYLP